MDLATYLVERTHARLEDHVGVEQKGAQERLGVAGQLRDDPDEQQVNVERVLQHVLQLRQNHADEGACGRSARPQDWPGPGVILPPQQRSCLAGS